MYTPSDFPHLHLTFSGAYATARKQGVLYVTERCVFTLTPAGLELIEVAPGIDIERDILALMDFKPAIPRDPILMDPRIFREGAMDLREDMLTIPLDQRFTLDELQSLFFVNLERYALHGRADIDAIAGVLGSYLVLYPRARVVTLVPIVFFVIFILLYMTFHSASEATIVMLSVVFDPVSSAVARSSAAGPASSV